jgi:hypothetical protein
MRHERRLWSLLHDADRLTVPGQEGVHETLLGLNTLGVRDKRGYSSSNQRPVRLTDETALASPRRIVIAISICHPHDNSPFRIVMRLGVFSCVCHPVRTTTAVSAVVPTSNSPFLASTVSVRASDRVQTVMRVTSNMPGVLLYSMPLQQYDPIRS